MSRISYLNGQFLPHEQCMVHIEDRGFQFADGAYEVTLFENGRLIDGEPHLVRLMRSLKELNIEHSFSAEQLRQIQLELFAKNNFDKSATCYIQITRGTAQRHPSCPKNIKPTICATVSPRKLVSNEEFVKGFKVMTSQDIRWHRCDIKTVNLLASTLTNQKAKDLGFDDALFIRDNVVTEATYANIFMVDDKNNLITHPADNNILCGITRNRLIALAKNLNIGVIERKFSVAEIMKAREVFLTSSSLLIRPVFYINNQEIAGKKSASNPSIAKILSDAYIDFINS
ncbi:MAG: D-amino acid aminotransferase [Alphaproteobacteria bacterium]|nr:D-amino acid aminotransferase [Alphaproteobacteria bacterium]